MADKRETKKILKETISTFQTDWEMPPVSMTGRELIERGDAIEMMMNTPGYKKFFEPYLRKEIAGTALHLTFEPNLINDMEKVSGMRAQARAYDGVIAWLNSCIRERNQLQKKLTGKATPT